MPFTFFLDDSDRVRSAEQPGLGIFGMGGVIVPTSELCGLEHDIEALSLDTFGEPVELKWHMPRSSVVKVREGKTQEGLREAMFGILTAHGCESIVTLIYDVRRENSPVGRDKMRAYAFEACVQRLQIQVGRTKDPGPHFVVVDTPPDGPKQASRRVRQGVPQRERPPQREAARTIGQGLRVRLRAAYLGRDALPRAPGG